MSENKAIEKMNERARKLDKIKPKPEYIHVPYVTHTIPFPHQHTAMRDSGGSGPVTCEPIDDAEFP